MPRWIFLVASFLLISNQIFPEQVLECETHLRENVERTEEDIKT